MSFSHESLKRLLTDSTLHGSVRPALSDVASVREFTCHVQQVQNQVGLQEWSLIGELSADSQSQQVVLPVSVQWAGSVPIISLQEFELPDLGTIQRAEVMLHNGLFAGMWVCKNLRGHIYGRLESLHKSERPECYVIERSGEALREWWTGEGWSEDFRQAQWYEHEPNAPRETSDEGSHHIYYPRGKIEAG